ncbi:MAG: carbohydrate ABC transporter permease [Dictyoglomaceae bacterium]
MKRKDWKLKFLIGIIITIALIWTIIPLFWILTTSFKTPTEQFMIPPTLLPRKFTLQNYVNFFTRSDLVRKFFNSVFVTTTSTITSLILGIPAAYALARFNFKHANLLSFIILLARMMPPIVMVVPFFMITRFLNLSDSYIPIIIASLFLSVPFAVWMMRGFFAEVPESIEEAAMVDGCTRFQALYKIVLPLVLPGTAATAILCAIIAWNQFLFALILTGPSTGTLPILVSMFITEKNIDWGTMSAAAIVMVTPMVVFGLLVQNNLVRGLTVGSLR